MSTFEQEVNQDINFLTGLAVLDPHNAFTKHVSEQARLSFGFNDDLSGQYIDDQVIRQYFIAELGPMIREIMPQVVIARELSIDLSKELGWQIGVIEDFHLGTMSQQEQSGYFAELPAHLTPIEAGELDAALLLMAEAADDAWVY